MNSKANSHSQEGSRYPERLNDCFARLTHEGCNLGKVAFLPQRFVWIHDSSLSYPEVTIFSSTGRALVPILRMAFSERVRTALSSSVQRGIQGSGSLAYWVLA